MSEIEEENNTSVKELKSQCEKIRGNKHPLYDETWAEYADRNGITYDKEDEKSCRSYIKSYETWYSAKSENENNNNNSGNGGGGNNQSEDSGRDNQSRQEENSQNNSENQGNNNHTQQNKQEYQSSQSSSITKEEHANTVDFTSFGKTLNPSDKQEFFLISELKQMSEICRSDKLLSSLVSPDLNISIRVIHDDKRQAPIYDDMSKSLIYHQQIVDNQMNNKGKDGINYYTQSSLFHELVHAEQMQSGLKPAQMKMAGNRPCFVVENAYDLMGIEAECKMLNAMYHIKAWQKEGKSLDEIKQHCLTLKKEGKEFEHGNVIPEYIDAMTLSQQQGKTNDEAHLAAGKQIILSLMSGNYPEWKNMYLNQINTLTENQVNYHFSKPEQEPSIRLRTRLLKNYGITRADLENCRMTQQIRESRPGYTHYAESLEKGNSNNKSHPQSQTLADIRRLRALRERKTQGL